MTNKTENQLSDHVQQIILHIQQHIDEDESDGTNIAYRYDSIQLLLDNARSCLVSWDLDAALDVIWQINLDTLQELNTLDDTISDVIKKLKKIQSIYTNSWKHIPMEIHDELFHLKSILKKYDP